MVKMMADPIRILLIDAHQTVRAGLRALLGTEADMMVIGEAEGGETAVSEANTHQPDIIIMDAPSRQDLHTIRTLKSQSPHTSILVLTNCGEHEHIRSIMQEGANGYLLKDNNTAGIIHAIRDISLGKPVLHPVALNTLIHPRL